jgi:hypothetical protein
MHLVTHRAFRVETAAPRDNHFANLYLVTDVSFTNSSVTNSAGAICFASQNSEFNGYNVAYARVSGVKVGSFYGGLSFATMHNSNDGLLRENVRIQNGQMGIGTSAPAYTLDISTAPTVASVNMTTWPRYAASLTHNVRGTISNAFNGGASNATFSLVFRTPAIALDTNLGTVTNDTAYGTYFVCKRSGLWNLTFQAHGGNQNTSIAIDISTNLQDNENPGGVAGRALAWLTMGYFVGSVTYTGYLPSNDNLYYKFKCNNNVLSNMQSNTWMTITFLGEQPTSASTWPR